MKLRFESLHTHTVISDGQQTHTEVLATAQQHGFGRIVFTDHDILPRKKDLKMLNAYNGPVRWEIGIEVSSGWPKEKGGGAANLFHILALNIDPTDAKLNEYCQTAMEARLERMKRTVDNLRSAGFELSLDRCLKLAGEGSAATPHLVRALFEQEGNVRLLENLTKQMASEAETDSEVKKQYEALKERQQVQGLKPLPYLLLLSDSAYVPGIYVPYLYSLDMDASVKMIRNAGGVAVLAHWPTVRSTIDERFLEELVSADRLDGLEIRSGFTASNSIESDSWFLSELADKYRLLKTIGIDSHEEDDFANFVQIPGAAEQTIGLWQAVVDYRR